MNTPTTPNVDPSEPATSRYYGLHLDDGTYLIYDPTNPDAWLQSTASVPLEDRY